MPRTVREIDAFYEATGPYAVSRPYAENIQRTSVAMIGRYVGPIAINSIRGVNLPLSGPKINPLTVKLSNAPHTALLTRREIVRNDELATTGGRTIVMKSKDRVVSTSVTTSVIEAPFTMNTEVTLTSNIHELGHAFGLTHCLGRNACVMEARLESVSDAQDMLASGKLFCEPCEEDLELAGYSELAKQL